jgi:hypothetical protein
MQEVQDFYISNNDRPDVDDNSIDSIEMDSLPQLHSASYPYSSSTPDMMVIEEDTPSSLFNSLKTLTALRKSSQLPTIASKQLPALPSLSSHPLVYKDPRTYLLAILCSLVLEEEQEGVNRNKKEDTRLLIHRVPKTYVDSVREMNVLVRAVRCLYYRDTKGALDCIAPLAPTSSTSHNLDARSGWETLLRGVVEGVVISRVRSWVLKAYADVGVDTVYERFGVGVDVLFGESMVVREGVLWVSEMVDKKKNDEMGKLGRGKDAVVAEKGGDMKAVEERVGALVETVLMLERLC